MIMMSTQEKHSHGGGKQWMGPRGPICPEGRAASIIIISCMAVSVSQDTFQIIMSLTPGAIMTFLRPTRWLTTFILLCVEFGSTLPHLDRLSD